VLELVLKIGAPIVVGCVGLAYIISAGWASRTGVATAKDVRFSKDRNPGMFRMYVRGRYMSGAALIVVAIALAIVFRH